MIRLLLGLGAFLFLAFEFLGADHGQVPQPQVAVVQPLVIAPVAAPKRQVFIPAQPVVRPVAQPVVAMGVTEASATAADVTAAPETNPTGRLMHAPGGANVRTGPGTNFPIAGSLAAGDEVLAVDDASAPGWIRISVQGDGETGWVAARLLRE